MKKPLLLLLGIGMSASVCAQTLTDGLMMPKKTLCTGFMYTHDSWTDYWEGELKRDNGNVGKVTTQSLMWMGTYGITSKINLIAMLPYIKTKASMGTLSGMEGVQDLSIGVKYNFFGRKFEKSAFNTFAVLNFSTPLSDYSPDFFPLGLGTQTTNISYRLTAYYKIEQGWFINASAGYTWRSNTTLDRPSYFDGNEFYNSDEVKMPNVFDVFVSMGYIKNGLQAELNYIQSNTLGGGDIRRQDMPFVSNRMNAIRVGATVMYYLPKPKGLAVRGSAAYTVDGRNMGQSQTFMGGLMYTIQFNKNQ
ncbi:MAG TPA: transporter [Chryseolinea sp.]|nr:transporter [Chryseolinea sp.]